MQNAMVPEMQNAIGVASIYGPFLLILGIWMFFYQANVKKVITSVKGTPGAMYAVGLLYLLIGLAVLSQFNVWTGSLTLLVTLFGWAAFLRGLLVFFAPQVLFSKALIDPAHLQFKGVILFAWGFGMSWLAFWM